jgi:MULE transposase domain
VTRTDGHCHLPDITVARRGLLLQQMHKRINDNPTQPVRRVYDDAVRENSDDSDDIPAFSNVRSRTKRYRSQFVPPIPTAINDVNIQDEWAKTWKGRQFLNYCDNVCGYALFTTRRMLTSLQQATIIYVDGTFRTAPRPYMQLVTVHGRINGFVIPLVFVLMTGKSTNQYTQVLQRLKAETLRLTQQSLNPRRIILDFEQSLMAALSAEFPTARLAGCYFHFSQSLWRHIQHLGLATDYRRHRRLKHVIRKVMAIGFVPTLLVRKNFNLLRTSRRVQRLVNTFPRLNDWLDYVDATYIHANALFRPALWNVYDRKSHSRTNNHVEGMHV